GGRRVTGVVTEMPPSLKILLIFLFAAAGVALTGYCGWLVFSSYYRNASELFVLRDVRESVTINTGKTLTPDLVCEVLGLHEGVNIFSLDIAAKRRELLEQAPNIKDMSIVRRMPNKLMITIVEREPVARVGTNGRVVDEEGVVFIRYAGIGGLPLIKGMDGFAQIKPGDRLYGNDMAAVRLAVNSLRPECRLRLLALDASKADYLFLTFSDYRQAKFSWAGMGDFERHSELGMQVQFDRLAQAMESDIGRPRMVWDATQPDRIFAMPLGVQ
ncbi:MAG: FtsQ-type POTRA domain-containing protein, partial [Kiritimatiellae bacterium]|nr:FtsQ-type POTRA domain-containing protein [Kiritimatiellia bacterium]